MERGYDVAIAYAKREGTSAGEAAASWYFDGNTSQSTYERVLKGVEDGDPEILDTFPLVDLSGQWADVITGPALVHDALAQADIDSIDDAETYEQAIGDWFDDICEAYEAAFDQAAQDEIVRACRYQIGA